MSKQKTIYHLIVDKSGSMSDCIDNTIMGFNEQVIKINQLAKEFPNQEVSIGLTTFNEEVSHHFFQKKPNSVEKLTEKTYRPSGGTALLDAIGESAQRLQKEAFLSELSTPTTVVVVIITDGHENSSKSFTFDEVRKLIRELEGTEKWTFSFIGATLDAVEVAEDLAIKRNNSFSFEKRSMNSSVWDKLSDSMHSYLDKKTMGKSLDNLFED